MRPRTRTLALCIVLAAAALPVTAAAPPPPLQVSHSVVATPSPHPAIAIDGDAGFAQPTSGVRSGTGTPSDPYVIEGWAVSHTNASAIRLANTTRHVVIRDIYVDGQLDRAGAAIGCVVWTIDCGEPAAIRIVDAENVRVERLRVVSSVVGIYVLRSHAIHVQDALLGLPPPTGGQIGDGVRVFVSSAVTLENVTVHEPQFPLLISNSADVRVAQSSFHGGTALSNIVNSANVTIVSTLFERQPPILSGALPNFTFVGNRIEGTFRGLTMQDAAANTMTDGYICGNTFADIGWFSVYLRSTTRVEVTGNHAVNASRGILSVFSNSISVTRNHMNVSQTALAISSVEAEIHENSFVGAFADLVSKGSTIDASGNWWGASDGPGGAGPGSGTTVTASGASVIFTPWLTASPPLDMTCRIAYGPAGSTPHAAEAQASATAHAHVHVNERILGQHVHVNKVHDAGVATGRFALP